MAEPISATLLLGAAAYGAYRWRKHAQLTRVANKYGLEVEGFGNYLEKIKGSDSAWVHDEAWMENIAKDIKKTYASRDNRMVQLLDKLRQEEKDAEDVLANLQELLQRELDAQQKFKPPRVSRRYKKIVIIGNTGDGKSTLANRLMGDTSDRGDQGQFATTDLPDSQTQTVEVGFVHDKSFCVVDTPGRGDSGGAEVERIHIQHLVDFLYGIGQVEAFLLCRNFKNHRLSQGDQAILQAFQDLLGDGFWMNTILVCTNVDDETDEKDFMRTRDVLREAMAQHHPSARHLIRVIETISIGRRNLTSKRKAIFDLVENCNHGTPFECDRLIAPVEQRKAEVEAQQRVVDEIKGRVRDMAEEQEHLKAIAGIRLIS